jgi:hypothetical protein
MYSELARFNAETFVLCSSSLGHCPWHVQSSPELLLPSSAAAAAAAAAWAWRKNRARLCCATP